MSNTQAKYSEKSIANHLRGYYSGNAKYRISNVYVFAWESDFFVLRQNGYICDYEIKISRSDYFADFKKTQRHEILQHGQYLRANGKPVKMNRPNKFFYVVPKDMIRVEEVPAYAGLIYVDNWGGLTFVKEAPFLHKEIVDVYKQLADKFYHRWNDAYADVRRLDAELKFFRENPNYPH